MRKTKYIVKTTTPNFEKITAWTDHRECHILPDWLLVYRIEDEVLVLTLTRTGTHSDLFGK